MEPTVTCMICGRVFDGNPLDWRGLGRHAETHLQEVRHGD
jgi:hypothetical protein